MVATLLGELVGQVEQARQVIADIDVALLPADLRQPVEQPLHTLLQERYVDLGLGQQRRGGAAVLIEQRRHHVGGFQHVVVAPDRQ